jgi:hypothetical protein
MMEKMHGKMKENPEMMDMMMDKMIMHENPEMMDMMMDKMIMMMHENPEMMEMMKKKMKEHQLKMEKQ